VEQVINVSNLTFTYGNENILHQLNFDIARSSFISIVGPNGSGKSTLLKNLSASLIPQKGVVLLEHQDIFKINRKVFARQVAVVPQETGADFDFSVLDTVLMGRMPHQKRFAGDSEKDMAIARWAMELTNTWYLRERLITNLSGGERQRVIVARALTQEPRILLLDEPTSHLDIQHQYELLELLETLNRTKQLTVVAVLHDLNLAAQFSQKVMLLKQGKIVAFGEPAQVLTLHNIRSVYKIEVVTMANEITGRFNIIPLGKSKIKQQKPAEIRIHLVCGGGKGSYLMEQLFQYGYKLSCGVLNVGDTDWNKARELGLAVAEEAPFAPISSQALTANDKLMEKADVIVVLPIPIGPGNLPNLEQVLAAQSAQDKKVIIVENDDIRNRDFSGGRAEKIIKQLLTRGAFTVAQAKDVLDLIGSTES